MSRVQEIRENVPAGEFLREAAVDGLLVQNVSLLGKVSKNGRTYSEQAMQDAVRLYDGARFYLDHPTSSELRARDGNRSVRDLAGRIRNPRQVGERVRGSIELLDREPTKSLVFALAEQMPEQAGLSHRARGEVRVNDAGQQVVETLSEVFAVELVTEPATVEGLFESVKQGEKRQQEVREGLIHQGVPVEVVRGWGAGLVGLIAQKDDPEARQEAVEEVAQALSEARTRRRVRREWPLRSTKRRPRVPDGVVEEAYTRLF